jgi:hypothetical protein
MPQFNPTSKHPARALQAWIILVGAEKAVYRAVYTEVNARTQAEASRLGEVTFLSDAEAQTCVSSIEGQVPRAWDFWKKTGTATHNALSKEFDVFK